MNNKGMHILAIALLIAFVVTAAIPVRALAASGGVTGSDTLKMLAKVRQATNKYHDVNVAVEDGYVPITGCVSSPDGGMGIHYGKISLLMDPAVSALSRKSCSMNPPPMD